MPTVMSLLQTVLIAMIVISYSYFVGRIFANILRISWIPSSISVVLGLGSTVLTVFYISLISKFSEILVVLTLITILVTCFIISYKKSIRIFEIIENKKKVITILVLGISVGLISCLAIYPHQLDTGRYLLSAPMLDNGKVAIVNSIIRDGLPVTNPYGISSSGSEYLHYYYFWYFICAVIGIFFHCTGYLATISLLTITGALSFWIIVMLSERICPKQKWIFSYFIVMLAIFLPNLPYPTFFRPLHSLEGMLYQLPWVPQHVFLPFARFVSYIL